MAHTDNPADQAIKYLEQKMEEIKKLQKKHPEFAKEMLAIIQREVRHIRTAKNINESIYVQQPPFPDKKRRENFQGLVRNRIVMALKEADTAIKEKLRLKPEGWDMGIDLFPMIPKDSPAEKTGQKSP